MHLESRPQAVQTDPTLPALISRFTATIYSAVSNGTLVAFGVMLVIGPRKSILMISHALIDTDQTTIAWDRPIPPVFFPHKSEVYPNKVTGVYNTVPS